MRGVLVGLPIVLIALLVSFVIELPSVGIAALVLWLAWAAMVGLKTTASQRVDDPRDEMDAESRSLYAPIRRLTDEIEEIVRQQCDSAIVKVVGGEAVEEARRIRDQVGKALEARTGLKKATREKNLAGQQAEELQARATAAPEGEKDVLLSALQAKQIELDHYRSVDALIAKIDAGTAQAKAALSEMKVRLGVRAANEKTEVLTDDDDLRDTIGRLKSLSVSYDEAEHMLQN